MLKLPANNKRKEERPMKGILVSTLTAAAVTAMASAEAAPLRPSMADDPVNNLVRVQEYQLPFELRFGTPQRDQYRDDWNDDRSDDSYYESDRRDIKSPQWIVRHLERNDYTVLSKPDLGPEGMFYRVRAINPDGREVKLRLEARTGRIDRIDFGA
jgi:hypothetical protein